MKAQSFVGAEKAAGHGVARACRLLKVSRAAYHQWFLQAEAVPGDGPFDSFGLWGVRSLHGL